MKQKFLNIENNVDSLTVAEQKAILSANYYVYAYGVGVIMLHTDTTCINWDCTNSTAAKDYLDKNKIREVK